MPQDYSFGEDMNKKEVMGIFREREYERKTVKSLRNESVWADSNSGFFNKLLKKR